MLCAECKKSIETKGLGVCNSCTSIKWSRNLIRTSDRSSNGYLKARQLVKAQVSFLYNKENLYSANSGDTFYVNGKRCGAAYVIKLDKSWIKNNVAYDYYVGGTGKHPAIRFLEHLIPQYDGDLARAKAMQHVIEFIYEEGWHNDIHEKLEIKLSKLYCKKGFVYSDKHKCKKCRTL